MKPNILHAEMKHDKRNGYFGKVHFEVPGHKRPYELTLQSDDRPDDWNYALNFLSESGGEQEIERVERAIEEDDAFFDALVEAAVNCLSES